MYDQSSEIYFKPSRGSLQKLVTKNFLSFKTQKCNKGQAQDEAQLEEKSERVFSAEAGVPSMYDQCMELLSNFTHCFESLIDFPEDFGREIFAKASDKLLQDNEETKQSLALFSEAYPCQFMPSCSLTKAISLINNYELSLPGLISRVVSLEIIDSDLDDDHDILEVILTLPNLENLNLSGNNLTDKGIRRIVMPMLGKNKTSRLKYLDVSFNNLEERAIKRLKLLQGLETLIVGEGEFKNSETIFKPNFVRRPSPRIQKIETYGFGSTLLERWREDICLKAKAKKEARESSSSFYSRPESVQEAPVKMRHGNKIMFSRTNIPPPPKKDSLDQGRKRKLDSIENIPNKKPRESKDLAATKESSQKNDFCDDLLKMYSS